MWLLDCIIVRLLLEPLRVPTLEPVIVDGGDISTNSGNLNISPAGDLVFNPTGNDVYPATNYDLNLGLINKKFLALHAAELWVETLVAANTLATIGGRILVGPTAKLTEDIGASETLIFLDSSSFSAGDILLMESDGKVEFMFIQENSGGGYYTVIRDYDGTGANIWFAGDAVFNMGQAGDGFIDIYSVRGIKENSDYGPTIVGNVRNSSDTHNDWTEAWAIGNLNGLYGYSSDVYGAAFGKYSVSDYITIDSLYGIRFQDDADVTRGHLQSGIWTLGYIYSEHVNITPTSVQIKDNSDVYAELALGTLTLGVVSSGEYITIDGTNGYRAYGGGTQRVQISNDGSGWLAGSDKLAWDTSGNISMTGNITLTNSSDYEYQK